ncbi:polysaccharide export protein EpsE [Oxalobacteraceae bacterium OTU3CINTB1]|nr:polysaccharide export protein EpsE [Oxalobacteraceae bacterium OTU3CINTB1]
MIKRFSLWLATLALALAGAAHGADLPLGTADVLKISVYNNPDLTTEARVSEGGFVTFPLLGQVAVAGLAPAAAEKKIAALLESGGFVKKPQVNILVTLIQSQQVSVLGQVNRPGRFPIDASRSVLDVLALAGGVNLEGGDVISVLRKRNGTTTKDTIDLEQMVRSGNTGELDLAGGDVVYVERAPRFFIYGEVQRPGLFRLERSMTVLQALAAGGGLTPRGTERGLRIKRRDAAGKLQILEAQHDDLVRPDDVVYVKESLF